MSPRHKTATDSAILDAAARVILRVGPTSLRLADVADEVGLAPATLLQRFTSKRALLLAVAEHGTRTVIDEFATRRARASSPLDALLGISPQVQVATRSRRCLTNKLAFLQLGLSDPVFRRHINAHHRAVQDALTALLEEAVAIGELTPCDTRAVAHALMAIWHGSMLLWTLSHQGSVEAHLRADMEAVLLPYRTTARPAARAVPSDAAPPRRGRTAARRAGAPSLTAGRSQ